ncbi:MAG TPA: DUF6249 domain-containing protein [Bryobacteraceae bacterium]|nr:DUF6249 domain-containing protein [Bryobacteraceae bacterium]
MNQLSAPMFLFLSVAVFALFSFVAIAAWADARRKEREAYYKSETIKKIAEATGPGANAALELMREEARNAARRHRAEIGLGGLVTSGVGLALMVFLAVIGTHGQPPVFMVGLIPLAVGVTLLVYAYWIAPKE